MNLKDYHARIIIIIPYIDGFFECNRSNLTRVLKAYVIFILNNRNFFNYVLPRAIFLDIILINFAMDIGHAPYCMIISIFRATNYRKNLFLYKTHGRKI